MNHSLAPWKVDTDLAGNATVESQRTITEIQDANGERIAVLDNSEHVQANADLMAASPKLFNALSWAVEYLSGWPRDKNQRLCLQAAREALKEARG